jgi:hypothetical protein
MSIGPTLALTEEQQKYIDDIVAQARVIQMQAGNEFHYGQYIGLLRAANIIEKGSHEDFSNPRLSGEARSADRPPNVGG